MPRTVKDLVVIGGGQAGLQLAASARSMDSDIEITIVSDENVAPYQRPPLSKAFLLEKMNQASLSLQSENFYRQKRITVLTGSRVAQIDRLNRKVCLANGSTALPYDRLAIATGSRPRRLFAADGVLSGVFYLRDLQDALALRLAVAGARNALVIGGGFIGLEFAAVARVKGLNVTVVEAGKRLMGRATSEPVSDFFESTHASRGITILKDTAVERLHHVGGKLTGATLSNGQTIEAELALIGVGALANDQLATSAGLPTSDGVLVDAGLRTPDENIFAIGDCARVSVDGDSYRMESVQNAVDQGRYVARNLEGACAAYGAVPWFWSDQYNFKLQIVGLPQDITSTVYRGDPAGGKFSAYHFRRAELISVESVNQPAAHVIARQLFERNVSPSSDQCGDPAFELRTLIPSISAAPSVA